VGDGDFTGYKIAIAAEWCPLSNFLFGFLEIANEMFITMVVTDGVVVGSHQ
jgi:hypothetical protein